MAETTPEAVAPVSPPLPGRAVIQQHWRDAVFLHWRVAPASGAPWLPEGTRPERSAGGGCLGGVVPVPAGAPRVPAAAGRAVARHVPRDERAPLRRRPRRAA